MASLYLVDSSIFVFQAWHSQPDSLCNRNGEPNNAWLGFTDFVHQLLTVEKPRELVFAFDRSLRSSLRHEIYPEYKANRPSAPEELKRQFRWCEEWVQALGFSAVSSTRYEADDLIGSLAERHRSEKRRIVAELYSRPSLITTWPPSGNGSGQRSPSTGSCATEAGCAMPRRFWAASCSRRMR